MTGRRCVDGLEPHYTENGREWWACAGCPGCAHLEPVDVHESGCLIWVSADPADTCTCRAFPLLAPEPGSAAAALDRIDRQAS